MSAPLDERLLQRISEQCELLSAQTSELVQLRQSVQTLKVIAEDETTYGRARALLRQERNKRDGAEQKWQEIRKHSLLDDVAGNLIAYIRKSELSLDDLFSGEQIWNGWAYRCSYPSLTAFLDRATSSYIQRSVESPRSRFSLLERSHSDKFRKETQTSPYSYSALWRSLATPYLEKNIANGDVADDLALTRTLKLTNVSPKVCTMLLACTPRLHVSRIAIFLERYVSFCNWAGMTMWGQKSATANAFTMEYHIGYYSIPQYTFRPGEVPEDPGAFRKAAAFSAFGPASDRREGSRWIFEEQISFILIGLDSDAYTCYQLSEQYHNIPGAGQVFANEDGFLMPSRAVGPSAVFLNWLTLAFDHAVRHWLRAIEAVNEKTDTAAHIVFSGENPELLADDPSFTKSRTYFWSLQVLKVFAERLSETIETWNAFKEENLPCLNDGLLPSGHLEISLTEVEASVDKLRSCLDLTRKKNQEVESLRQGLFGASALFDSRTAVRQGDNIRLLTYITLLFLPLSFSTSIYGMQVVLPSPIPIKYFAITLGSISVATALIVFNLHDIVELWNVLAQQSTRLLRAFMRSHHQKYWREAEEDLRADRVARQPPLRKVQKKSTHWVYLLVLLEVFFVYVPVRELRWAATILRMVWDESMGGMAEEQKTGVHNSTHPLKNKLSSQSLASQVLAVKVAELENEARRSTRFRRSFERVASLLVSLVRTSLLLIWIPLAALEYGLLLPISIVLPLTDHNDATTHPHRPPIEIVLHRPLLWLGFTDQGDQRIVLDSGTLFPRISARTNRQRGGDQPYPVARSGSNLRRTRSRIRAGAGLNKQADMQRTAFSSRPTTSATQGRDRVVHFTVDE